MFTVMPQKFARLELQNSTLGDGILITYGFQYVLTRTFRIRSFSSNACILQVLIWNMEGDRLKMINEKKIVDRACLRSELRK